MFSEAACPSLSPAPLPDPSHSTAEARWVLPHQPWSPHGSHAHLDVDGGGKARAFTEKTEHDSTKPLLFAFPSVTHSQ